MELSNFLNPKSIVVILVSKVRAVTLDEKGERAMKRKRNVLAKVLSAVMVVSLMAVGAPGNAEASWTPETKHDIPGYQFKDIYATEKVKVTFPVN